MSRDSNLGHPKRNSTTCLCASPEAINADRNMPFFFYIFHFKSLIYYLIIIENIEKKKDKIKTVKRLENLLRYPNSKFCRSRIAYAYQHYTVEDRKRETETLMHKVDSTCLVSQWQDVSLRSICFANGNKIADGMVTSHCPLILQV